MCEFRGNRKNKLCSSEWKALHFTQLSDMSGLIRVVVYKVCVWCHYVERGQAAQSPQTVSDCSKHTLLF